MKKSQIIVFNLLLTSSMFSLVSAQDNIQRGLVNMRGEILESACTIDINSVDQTIDMGNIPVSSVRDNNENNIKEFELKLIDCRWGEETRNNLTSVDISFSGQSEADYFLLEGDARGIKLGLESISGEKIIPSETIVFEHDFTREIASRYRFRLVPDGNPVESGSFNTIVHFNISYK
ncbi:fimbrial protein [Acinetobacter equi]|uniref:Fimbrial-type adhesion domain-containing protein n=1 Tax=Acinetobacter equi TaxID=1324350 RepID=A0A0N9VDT7_9GAMM|nr:fimbrial protein [Acinetobacter equi]ALH95495.1 hypothetical protein AOY20_08130 [Acinetobacter equi]